MLTSHQRLVTFEQLPVRKMLNNRKSLQMAVLTIHDSQNKYNQKKNIQEQINYSNRQQRHIFLRRVSAPKINILQSIKTRKSFQSDKKAQLNMPNKSQSPIITQIHQSYSNINKEKSQKNFPNIMLLHRMNHKLQKLHQRGNINLLLRNRKITKTQRILAEQNITKQQKLNQSLSCRQILVQESKLFSNTKIKHIMTNSLHKTKISIKINRKEKVQSRSLESKLLMQPSQDRFSGWETNKKFLQQSEAQDDKIQVFQL